MNKNVDLWVPMREQFGEQAVNKDFEYVEWTTLPNANLLDINLTAFEIRSKRLFYPDKYLVQAVSDTTTQKISFVPNESGVTHATLAFASVNTERYSPERNSDGYVVRIEADKIKQKTQGNLLHYSQGLNQEICKKLAVIDSHDRKIFAEENSWYLLAEGAAFLFFMSAIPDALVLLSELSKMNPSFDPIRWLAADLTGSTVLNWLKRKFITEWKETNEESREMPPDFLKISEQSFWSTLIPVSLTHLFLRTLTDRFQNQDFVRLHQAKRS